VWVRVDVEVREHGLQSVRGNQEAIRVLRHGADASVHHQRDLAVPARSRCPLDPNAPELGYY